MQSRLKQSFRTVKGWEGYKQMNQTPWYIDLNISYVVVLVGVVHRLLLCT